MERTLDGLDLDTSRMSEGDEDLEANIGDR